VWFSRLVRRSARKWSESILTTESPHGSQQCVFLCVLVVNLELGRRLRLSTSWATLPKCPVVVQWSRSVHICYRMSESRTRYICFFIHYLISHSTPLPLHFNGHFPGKAGLAGFIGAKGDGGGSDNWSYKSCKAPVKSSPPTNQHSVFSHAGCTSLSKHWRENISYSSTRLILFICPEFWVKSCALYEWVNGYCGLLLSKDDTCGIIELLVTE